LLRAAKTKGNPKRVVITGSFASMMDTPRPDKYMYSEIDWNESSSKLITEQGEGAGAAQAYLASKAEAERAAWKFMEQEKVTICARGSMARSHQKLIAKCTLTCSRTLI
jgi:nucleoside-diphosphate-sugar epimerase